MWRSLVVRLRPALPVQLVDPGIGAAATATASGMQTCRACSGRQLSSSASSASSDSASARLGSSFVDDLLAQPSVAHSATATSLQDFYRLSGRKPVRPQKISGGRAAASGGGRRSVPDTFPWPPYATTGVAPDVSSIRIKDALEIAGLRRSCRLARQALRFAETLVRPGITTDEIDAEVHKFIVSKGAYPSPLNYNGFPKSICTSVNEVMCHGIPDGRALRPDDIINIDVTVYLNGFHGDTALNFAVSASVPEAGRRLMRVTQECLDRAIAVCGPGERFHRIGAAIQQHASAHGLSVVPDFTGHGIGRDFHEPPYVFSFANDFEGTMQPGMVFTIEPILVEGSPLYEVLDDGWTVVAVDGGLSAQAEHTVLITDSGVDVLTRDM